MEREINKKLRNMKKSQLEKVCGKMRCPKGTRKEMIGHLLRPLRKYKMDKIPSELIDYLGKFEGKQEIGRLASTSKGIRRDLLPELERRRFHATDQTLKGAVEEYIRNKRSAIRKYGDISGWDVSNVTNMSRMFHEAYKFNGDLSKWNVSNVTNMRYMFGWASSFNGDLSKWNVSNVTNMEGMFLGTFSFNGDISGWDVSNVTNMEDMFWSAKSFNGDLSKWNVSNVRYMDRMFREARSFNGDLSKWNVSNVRNMGESVW
jgi:surface protein